jgi:hypothetical protein
MQGWRQRRGQQKQQDTSRAARVYLRGRPLYLQSSSCSNISCTHSYLKGLPGMLRL